MLYFINSLIPIIFLIALGYALKRVNFVSDAIWAGIEKLVYFVMFPALLTRAIGGQSVAGSGWHLMLLVIAVGLTVSALVVWLQYRFSNTISAPTFTSIFQGAVRFNSYIALSVAGAFYGPEGLALASIGAGIMIVLVNFYCVGVFVVYGSSTARSGATFLKQILVNPLIIGCAAGWALSLSGIGLPGVSADMLDILGRAALPLGLLAVGAALQPEKIPGHTHAILSSSLVQFLLKPILVIALASILNLPSMVLGVLLIAFMVPTASSAFILARQLGGDTETMASIITLQTVIAFVLMPFWAWLVLI